MAVTVIVPYRDRTVQLEMLVQQLLKPGRNVRAVVIAEQGDTGAFNRGAVKNAGFQQAVRQLCLQDTDTVCFHDVDVMPGDRVAYPDCQPNEIRHLYGHEHCLGGVVCVTVGDFRRLGMFAHWTGWGREDTELMDQAKRLLVYVNHSQFVPRFAKPGAASLQPPETASRAFYEVDDKGARQTPDQVRAALMAKIRNLQSSSSASNGDEQLKRGDVFNACFAHVVRRGVLHFYLFAI